MAEKKLKITFVKGAGTVTGANFLVETEGYDKNVKFIVDCGLLQGSKVCDDENRKPFPYDPSSLDFALITHAHIDHIGLLPKLVKEGFRGEIYSTPPTMDISGVMLDDSMGVLGKEAKRDKLPMIYEAGDVKQTMSQWQAHDYDKSFDLGPLSFRFKNAGHILGSAMIDVTEKGSKSKKLVFSGDLGNNPTPLLPDTDKLDGAHYLIMESVYGDRNHEDKVERTDKLKKVIKDTIGRGGTLMIPAFSLERTQELIYEIEQMLEAGELPKVPFYIDSPLAIKVTKFYKKYKSYLNEAAQEYNKGGDGILHFPDLKFTLETEESKAIDQSNEPKVILAGSGMSNGGRIVHHEKRFLPDPNNTLLLVGYQAVFTLGRRIQDGASEVTIHGEKVPVRAEVDNIRGYSAHKDSDQLLEFVADSKDTLKHVYAVMGEPKSSLFLVQRIRDYLDINASAPEAGQTVEIVL